MAICTGDSVLLRRTEWWCDSEEIKEKKLAENVCSPSGLRGLVEQVRRHIIPLLQEGVPEGRGSDINITAKHYLINTENACNDGKMCLLPLFIPKCKSYILGLFNGYQSLIISNHANID